MMSDLDISAILAAIFIFGVIIGSFLNVIILRYNTGRSIAGRSGCLSCSKKLTWYELIPVLSYVFLRGRCSECESPISLQYPLIELANGALYLLLFFMAPFTNWYGTFCLAVVVSTLLVIAVYDIRHMIIPDRMVYTFVGVGVVYFLTIHPLAYLHTQMGLTELFAGVLLAIPFALLWVVSKGTWIGLGDAKLVLGIGTLLGIVGGVSAIVLGFWIGAGVSLIQILYTKYIRQSSHRHSLGMKSEIPFAPYLILGTLIVLLTQIDVMHLRGFMGLF